MAVSLSSQRLLSVRLGPMLLLLCMSTYLLLDALILLPLKPLDLHSLVCFIIGRRGHSSDNNHR